MCTICRKDKLTPQEIQFERLKLASYNGLNGNMIAERLRSTKELWTGFVVGRFGVYDDTPDLIELRDISYDLNIDTVLIMTTKDNLPAMMREIESWSANEVGWTTDEECYGIPPVQPEQMPFALGTSDTEDVALIRVWWD